MRQLIVTAALVGGVAIADTGINPYPGAEEVESESADEAAAHLVVLGALEKVNHELVPEKSEIVMGLRSSTTWYLPQARRTREVAKYYFEQLEQQGEVVFQCQGRSCGSSSNWANKILDRAILYGPEQFQQFSVVQLRDGEGYRYIYIGQRATRKIYAHIEQVLANSDLLRLTSA